MLDHISLYKILFLDIETVPVHCTYGELNDAGQKLWADKTRWVQEREGKSPEEVYERAGIYAEFAKVVCVSVGFFKDEGDSRTFRIKSFSDDDEREVLLELAEVLRRYFHSSGGLLCAHNGKEFDFPFLARRYIVNQLRMPRVLDLAGKKPWEVSHLDTMDLWKFGDYKHYSSVALLTYALGLPSPKDDISGADVAKVYYEEKGLERITRYCEKDVIAIARILLRFKTEPDLEEDQIVLAS